MLFNVLDVTCMLLLFFLWDGGTDWSLLFSMMYLEFYSDILIWSHKLPPPPILPDQKSQKWIQLISFIDTNHNQIVSILESMDVYKSHSCHQGEHICKYHFSWGQGICYEQEAPMVGVVKRPCARRVRDDQGDSVSWLPSLLKVSLVISPQGQDRKRCEFTLKDTLWSITECILIDYSCWCGLGEVC